MKRVYFLLTTLCLLSLSAFAQTGKISGQILTSDAKPAEFVSIGLKGSKSGTTTDSDGRFNLNKVKPGSYTLLASFVGLVTQEQEVEVKEGETATISLSLKEDANQLQEVVVHGGSGYKTNEVSSSLRIQTPILETPQNIQVVSSKVLSDQQIISMSDGLIRNVSGAARLEHWGDLYANITMRGSQIQAFRNGFNVVSSFWGPLTEDMSFVDHIEFVKGPAGFMLANGDPSGLYNVVTKKPTGQTKGEASITVGNYGLFRTALDLDGKLSQDGKLLYRLNVSGQNKKSFRANEYNNRYSIAPVVSYQIDEKTKLTAEYTLQYAKMSDVGSYYIFSTEGYATLPRDFTTLPAGLEPTKIKDHSFFLNLQHQFNSDWRITAQAAYFNYQQKGTSLWPNVVNPDGGLIRSVGIWDAASEMTLAQVFLNGNVSTGAVTHRILGGIDIGSKDYMADWVQSHALDTLGGEYNIHSPYTGAPNNGYPVWDRTLNLEARAVNGGGLMDQKYTGIYAQDELGFLNNKIRLTLAGRYTYVSQSSWGGPQVSDKHFTPRVGLSISLDKQTSLYALYDQAFTPQSGKLANGGTIKPLTGNNREIGIKKDWAGGKWNTTAAIYSITKRNELTADPNSPPNSGLSIVLGEKRAQGVEFDLRGTIVNGLNLVANYAYTDSKVTKVAAGVTDIKVDDVIPGFAKHTVNSWLSYKLQNGALKGTGISAGFTYLADRATGTWNTSNAKENLPNYFKLDGGLFWEKDNIKLTLNVFNILDEYLYSGSFYGYMGNVYSWQAEAPRNARFSINYKF
ncbi:TonB-dependent receptor [Dyadobacter psychrotolerans]|uniref:TonB-dependent receptor n=1 Tax=Dyadobacter psychrotolerans TaxID=2541721 RepID=A0A4R5DVV2_9BACT|nr:TonB-dependent receptor [Dyadobacter psychrotolerans]TDE18599.1 TonB-dependent receptor [Dyadobacter psychrotolerans]